MYRLIQIYLSLSCKLSRNVNVYLNVFQNQLGHFSADGKARPRFPLSTVPLVPPPLLKKHEKVPSSSFKSIGKIKKKYEKKSRERSEYMNDMENNQKYEENGILVDHEKENKSLYQNENIDAFLKSGKIPLIFYPLLTFYDKNIRNVDNVRNKKLNSEINDKFSYLFSKKDEKNSGKKSGKNSKIDEDLNEISEKNPVDLTPYNDYEGITCCDFRKNGLESSGCLKQFELFSKAMYRDYRYFGILLASILLRRALSSEERQELLDDKALYKDLIGPYGVLNSISRRCTKEVLSVLELCFRAYVPVKQIKSIQEVLSYVKDEKCNHKRVMNNWLKNNSIIKKEAEDAFEKLKNENLNKSKNDSSSKKEVEENQLKSEIEKLKNETINADYDFNRIQDFQSLENKNRILAVVCIQQYEAHAVLHSLGGTIHVYMCVYLCIFMYAFISICIYVYVYDYIYIYVFVCIQQNEADEVLHS